MHQSQALSPENTNIPTKLESPTNRCSNQALSPQYMHQSQALSPGNANIPTNLESPRGLHISTKSERPKTLAIPTNLESPTDLHSQDQKRSEGSDSEDMDSEDSMGNSLGVEMVAPLAKLVLMRSQR